MNDSCNVVSAFCTSAVQERILFLYDNLNKQGLLPAEINYKQSSFNTKNNNLFFISYNQNTKPGLQNLMSRMDLKKSQIVIISCEEENYFDFAVEYEICNIVHINRLNETILLGITKRFLRQDLCLESFFEHSEKKFDKEYLLSGNICTQNLIETTFADFISKIQNPVKNTFIINCHELVTNALAYGVLGITSNARDKRVYDIGKYVDIPVGKEIKIHLLMNEDLYGISVTDKSGTLTSKRILERIRRQCIVAGETIPQGIEDYTGRGLAILSHHGTLVFSIKPGEFTSVSLISHIKEPFEKKFISILATEL
ncbi:MAG: hypothetical protein LBC75_09140 [Fibromonadaceae bacterium]|jgi:hypothetical protein|nr:hypothetical protein [Fibromonadaceae bacterium]